MPVLRRPVEPAAQNGHGAMSQLSPLSGVERKLDFGAVRSAFDPTETSSLIASGRPSTRRRPMHSASCSGEPSALWTDYAVSQRSVCAYRQGELKRCTMG